MTIAGGAIEPSKEGTCSNVAPPRRRGGVAPWPSLRLPSLPAQSGAPFVPCDSVLDTIGWHGPGPPRPDRPRRLHRHIPVSSQQLVGVHLWRCRMHTALAEARRRCPVGAVPSP